MAYIIQRFCVEHTCVWDEFVEEKSMNGTFLQTRKFIEYHSKDKFKDHSLLIYKGNQLVAVILACEEVDEEEKRFISHKGTTYGGLIISNQVYTATRLSEIIDELEKYFKINGFTKIYMKQTPAIFCKENTDLIDYLWYQRGYTDYIELNYFLEMQMYKKDILSQFSSGKRRDYKYALKNNLEFKEISTENGIREFYSVLKSNLTKLGLNCIHSYEDLIDLKFKRFMDGIRFFGVYKEEKIIAGSMVFLFDNRVLHTQYLCSSEEALKYYPMDYLIYHLIEYGLDNSFPIFTFGICTENQGRYLNLGLSRFKEGFGSKYCLNKSYEKTY